jgi:hypothetical protein
MRINLKEFVFLLSERTLHQSEGADHGRSQQMLDNEPGRA